jgi:single-stranded-DNA-specific exonuclease
MTEVRVETRSVPAGARFPKDIAPLLARIYAARGLQDALELDRSLGRLITPDALDDIDRAAQRVAQAIRADESILIVGDYDADGATAVALSVSVLRALGANAVDFLVPNRFQFGYGLSPEIVALLKHRPPRVLITVDNGVSSVAGVAAANELGIDVIITDHHLPGQALPDAFAIVNPNLAGSGFPSRALAGVGVAYYLFARVRAALRDVGWFTNRPAPNLADWLDLVALGTVADVVPLDHNNRVLVHQGIARMRTGRCRPGIRALAEIAKKTLARLTEQDLGFALGPRLNAAGRLEDMAIGIRCLLADDPGEARTLARALDELNHARRELEAEMVRDAEFIVGQHATAAADRFGVCVYDPGWHQGIVGLVAGRLRERIDRPVIAFADAGAIAADELRGSARSIPALHVRDALDAIATRYPGMLSRFGGHAMAAGLTIRRTHYPRFARAFDAEVERRVPPSAFTRTLETDGSLDDQELSLATARLLRDAGPWGQGFPPPLFHDTFDVVSQRVVGQQHLRLVLRRGRRVVDAIAFRQAPLPDARSVAIVYRPEENDFGDPPTLQLVVEHLRVLA